MYISFFKLTLVFIFTSVSFLIKSQENFLGHQILSSKFNTEIDSFDVGNYRKILYKKYHGKFENDNYLKEFVDILSKCKTDISNKNFTYNNTDYIENYCKQVAEKIQLDKLLNTEIKIKIVKDPSFNAFVFEDGVIYINIGLFTYLKNEESLAGVLLHEVSHIINEDALNRFLDEKKFNKNQTINSHLPLIIGIPSSIINISSFQSKLIEKEERADLALINQFEKLKFKIDGLAIFFNTMFNIEEKEKNKLSIHDNHFYLSTHPKTNNRKKIINDQIRYQNASYRDFSVNKIQFDSIKKIASDETINLLFSSDLYNDALELAYKQYLYKPNDDFYNYFIYECLNRLTGLNNLNKDNFFITSNFEKNFLNKIIKQNTSVEPNKSKFYFSVHNNIIGSLFDVDSVEYLNMAIKYGPNDSIPYFNNKEALKFFSDNVNNKSTDTKKILNFTYNDSSNNISRVENEIIKLQIEKKLYDSLKTSYNNLVFLVPQFNYSYIKRTKFTFEEIADTALLNQRRSKTMRVIDSLLLHKYHQKYINILNYDNSYSVDVMGDKLIENYFKDITLESLGNKPKIKLIDYNTSVLLPEIIPVLNKYKAQRVLFIYFSMSECLPNTNPKDYIAGSTFKILYIDDIKQKLKYGYQSVGFSPSVMDVQIGEFEAFYLEKFCKTFRILLSEK